MLVPLGTTIYLFQKNPKNKQTIAFLVAVVFLVVFSSHYHSCCALNRFPDFIDNHARRADQTAQLGANALMAYAVSGSVRYFGVVAAYAAAATVMLWIKGAHDTAWVRRGNIGVALVLVLAVLLWHRDYRNFVGATASMAASVALFVYGGYGHVLSHVLLGPYMYFLFMATIQDRKHEK